jgi:CubicO group peptidase (beta-lactamase class C family)
MVRARRIPLLRRLGPSVFALGLVAGACASGTADAPAVTDTDVGGVSTESPGPSSVTTEVTDGTQEQAWPIPDWQVVDPAEAGLDPLVLEALAADAAAAGSDCFVVTHDGRIVGEWYWNGTGPDFEREAFSVTKSITSTLVGIAQDLGVLDIDQPASDFIHEWRGTPSEGVTIRNLLANDSGRFQTAESDYVQMATREADKSAYAIGLEQQHEVGTVWVYNNAAIQVLEEVLERATGSEVGTFAAEHLFGPLGMGSTIDSDEAGNTLTFMGAQMSCRDMARFGLLTLRGGEWNGTQVVSSAWISEATRPSTSLNAGYGLLWWLFGLDDDAAPTAPGQGAVPVGSDGYAALGLGGQIIAVVPDHDLVVTRLGAPGAGRFGLYDVLARLQTDLVKG